jgi:hypothetical protein
LFESESNIISDGMNDVEIDLVLAKNKTDVLEARNYVHG